VSELTELYLLFVALYLFESIAWVPRRSIGFFRFLGRWRARAAFRPNAGWSVGAVFGKPWPPLSPAWVAEPLPFAMDVDGISASERGGQRTGWSALALCTADGDRLRSGEQTLATLTSHSAARCLADDLERARLAPPKQRESVLREILRRRFDAAEAAARPRRLGRSVRLLRVSSNLLWLFLFGGLGVAAFSGHVLILIAAAALSVLLWPVNALIFARTLRRLDWLDRESWPTTGKRWVAYLSPLSGLRATDLIAREALAGLDPLAVAAALLSADDLAAFARPRLVAVAPRPDAPLPWWREQQRQQIERLLRERKLDPEQLLAAPRPEGTHVATYCPSCRAQYEPSRRAGEPCPDQSCADVPLVAFADSPSQPPSS
jgi:hypothetical protein